MKISQIDEMGMCELTKWEKLSIVDKMGIDQIGVNLNKMLFSIQKY